MVYLHLTNPWHFFINRDSAVAIATRYGLDGLGIESRWGRDFPHPSRSALRTNQHPIQGVPSLSEDTAAWAWRWTPTPSRAEIKERVRFSLLVLHGTFSGDFYLYLLLFISRCIFWLVLSEQQTPQINKWITNTFRKCISKRLRN